MRAAPRSMRGVLEGARERGDLGLRVRVFRKCALGAAVPVARIAEVSLEHVHDAVRPAPELGVVLLDDRVRLLPVALLEVAHCGTDGHGRLLKAYCTSVM